MENENKNPELEAQEWLDEILGKTETVPEIGPDEHAVNSARLTHPDDMELEKIVQETLAQEWDELHPQPEEAPAQPVQEPTQMFTTVQEQEAAAQDKPARRKRKANEVQKGRPERKKGYGLLGIPHIVVTLIWIFIAIAIGVTMGRTIWLFASDLLAFEQQPPQSLTIKIEEGDTVEDVARLLKEEGLIRYPGVFVAFADLTGKGEQIVPGTYVLNAPDENGEIPTHVYDYNALLNAMRDTGSSHKTVSVTFPEGYNCAQMFALLEEKGVCSVAELEAYAAQGELTDYWFLEGVDRGHKYCLEGFLAPDTYEFYTDDEPGRVLEKFLDEFDDRFEDRMKQQFETLKSTYASRLANRGYSQDFINANMLTLRDVITLASMVEKEAANDAESFDIAGVFFNRLTNPGNFPFLNSDATSLYAIEYYNKGELTTTEQINASPYNTYTHTGLPAGPITNPGANSLYAALQPMDNGCYYFVYDKSAGVHRLSKTLSEHEQWVRKLGLA